MPEAINYGTGFSSAWSNVATFVPKFVVFLIILVVGWLIAKVITKAISAVLTRVGFDKAVERGGIKKALESSKYDASDILAKIVYYALMLFVLSTAFGVFGNNPVSSYLHAVIAYLPLVFVAIIIVIIASAIAAAARALIENSLSGVSYAKVLGNVASGLILAFGIIAALDQLHVATNVVNAVLYAALAALVGVVVVAVGGGGIRTMSRRWEAVAGRYDEEKPKIAESARNAPPFGTRPARPRTWPPASPATAPSLLMGLASGTAFTASKATPAAGSRRPSTPGAGVRPVTPPRYHPTGMTPHYSAQGVQV